MKLHIPKPCHEDWNKMTPETQGRFCSSCEKTVVDFTNWSATDIQNYFTKHYQTKTCGRFRSDQLVQPVEIVISQQEIFRIPQHRYFLFALFIVFGTTLFSCTDQNGNRQTIKEVIVADSATAADTSSYIKIKPTTDTSTACTDIKWTEPTIRDIPDEFMGVPALPDIDDTLTGEVAPAPIPPEVEDSTTRMIVGVMDIIPEFPGGSDKLSAFLKKNLVYPQVGDTLYGKVVVQFTVDTTGSLKNIILRKSLGPAYDQAAIDVVRKMPNWSQGKRFGKKIEIQMVLPIVFSKQ